MKLDKLELERLSLQAIQTRWQRRAWPLERPNGTNTFLDSLFDLSISPLCWDLNEHQFTGLEITKLIDELEAAYYSASEPWAQLKTVHDSPKASYEKLRWPDGTYPAKVQKDASRRFWELVTTSRFSVNEAPRIQALEEVNSPMPPVTIQQVACLAAMVCIFDAIEALEAILRHWQDISEPYRGGKPFQWLTDYDTSALELILQTALKAPDEADFYQSQINDAHKASDQANAWLLQVENLQPLIDEIERVKRRAKLDKKKQANAASSKPRPNREKPVSTQQVGDFFNVRQGQKHITIVKEAADEFDVSESTIARRLKDYRKSTFTSGATDLT